MWLVLLVFFPFIQAGGLQKRKQQSKQRRDYRTAAKGLEEKVSPQQSSRPLWPVLETHVWVRKLAAAASFHRAFPVGVVLLCQEFTALFSGHLLFIWQVAKQTKGWAHEKDAKGTWTLALIYRLEAEFQTGIQMRNLFCDLRTQGNENACFLAMLRPHQIQFLDPFGGTASVDGVVVLSGRGQVLQRSSSLSG